MLNVLTQCPHLEVLAGHGLVALGADGDHASPELRARDVERERGALLRAHQATRRLVPPDAGHLQHQDASLPYSATM